MDAIIGVLLFVIIGFIFTLPLSGVLSLTKHLGRDRLKIHYALHGVFLVWAVYDAFFTYHYPHGLNTVFIIVPGMFAFTVFYVLVVPRQAPDIAQTTKLTRTAISVINSLFLIGLLVLPIKQ